MLNDQIVFQSGSRFVEISAEAICLNGKDRIMKIDTENAKKEIINFLKVQDKFYVSDLAERLEIKPSIVIRAIKELKGDGIIKETD